MWHLEGQLEGCYIGAARDNGGLDARNCDALRGSLGVESQDFHAFGVGRRVREKMDSQVSDLSNHVDGGPNYRDRKDWHVAGRT